MLAASPCWEAGGFQGVFGGLRPRLRGSWSLGCKATVGRVHGWYCSTKNLYFVSHRPAQPHKKLPQASILDLFSLVENGTLVGMKTLAEGDRWLSLPF